MTDAQQIVFWSQNLLSAETVNQDADEECDDGNLVDGDGCSSRCTIEGNPAACGDGNRGPDEECDDGNVVDGDGCSSRCTIRDVGPLNPGQLACINSTDA